VAADDRGRRAAAHLCGPLRVTLMAKRRGLNSSRKRRGNAGGSTVKRAADLRAQALASTIHDLKAAGFVSRRKIARELNRRRVPTARGGRWHYTSVTRLLARLR
jgi:hypothetical protein